MVGLFIPTGKELKMRKILVALMFITIMMVAGQSMADTYYQFVDLGVGMAFAVNNSNQIVGDVGSSPTFRPALFYNGTTTILDSRVGYAKEINEAGWIVGNTGGTTNNEAFLYRDGIFEIIGSSDGTPTEAYGVNNVGQISGTLNSRAAVWQNGIWTDLGIAPEFRSVAKDINDNGQIAGYVKGSSEYNAFLVDGSVQFLNAEYSEAINLNGQVAGGIYQYNASNNTEIIQPYIYQDSVFTVLNSVDYSSIAHGINSSGQVVGGSMLWNPDGSKFNLSRFVDPALHLYNLSAWDINDNGVIVGGISGQQGHAFMLYPVDYYIDFDPYVYIPPSTVPEPSSLALLTMGSLFLIRRRNAKK